MGEQTSEETEVSDAEKLYRLWVKYEYEVMKKHRRQNPSAAALKQFNKALKKRTLFVLELYIEYFYTSPDKWPSYMRVYGYTKPDNMFRKQNLGARVDVVVENYLRSESIPEYAYTDVEWINYRGHRAYVDKSGNPKIVFGGEAEIERWKSVVKDLGL